MRKAIFSPGAGFLLLAVFGLSAGMAYGETRTLTLREAVERALAANGELNALRGDKDVARAGTVRADLYPNPVLELEGSTGGLTGSSGENSLSVGLSQELLTGGKRAKRLAAAEREAEAVHWQIADRERLLALEVATAHADLLLAEKRLELAKRAVELNGRLLAVARERFAAGDIPELDVNLARVEALRSEGARIGAEREVWPVRARLLTLLGLPPGDEARFGDAPAPPPLAPDAAELTRRALENRPDLRALESARAASEAQLDLAGAEGVPNVTAGLFYSHERSLDATDSGDEKSRDNIVGIRLSIPLPFFDRNQAGVREARAKKGSAEVRLAQARAAIAREVEAAAAAAAASEKALALYASEILPQLEENLKLVQEAYQLGEVGILSVIEEQKKYTEVHDGYLAALAERQGALARLEAAAGVDFQNNRTSGGAQ